MTAGRRGPAGVRGRFLALTAAVVVATLALVAGAIGATHALAPVGCIEDNDPPSGPDTCAASTDGLAGAAGVAISPDGRSAYAVSFIDHAIVQFDRDATGALTPVGCIADNDTGVDACAVEVDGLARPFKVTVSPNGESVYVAAATDDAVVHFDRDTATGDLTWIGCVDDNDSGADACAASTDGLDGAFDVAVSPDGTSVYVSGEDDDAIVHLTRNTGTGVLTPVGCIDDNTPGRGPDACGGTFAGLQGARGIGISPDGTSVYLAATTNDSIVTFTRNLPVGNLSYTGCIDDNDTGLAPCATSIDGMRDARSIAISANGESLYVAAAADDAIVRFDRDTGGGGLLPMGCIDDNDSGADTCAASTDGLDNVSSVAITPDGQSLYATSTGDDALVGFDRDTATGAVAPAGCVIDNDASFDSCPVLADGLDNAAGIAISPDGNSVYTAAQEDDAVARFERSLVPDLPPVVEPDPPPGDPPAAVPDTDPPETTITKTPKRKTGRRKAKYRFESDEPGSTFACKIDEKRYQACESPYKKVALRYGRHTFRVHAIDPAGNPDPTDAIYRWKVRRPD